MVDGLITDYIAQMDWAYNRDVVHPQAARQRGWLQEIRRARTGVAGRRWWASVLAGPRRRAFGPGREPHAVAERAEDMRSAGSWAAGAERSAR
jgi:hypothetical protein